MSSNAVTITSPLIHSINYISGSLVITTGESSSPPPSVLQSGDKWTITLEAGRSGSKPVADSFNTLNGGSIHEYAPDGGGTGHTPNELNFYFGVTITFLLDGVQIPTQVYFAQGHYSTTNNWWIGANSVINTGQPMLLLISNNTIQRILNMSGGVSSFVLK
jgi:hypothetical protein